MKKLLLSLPLLALPFAVQAQTVYTDPVGVVVQNLSFGNQIVSIPFQKAIIFQGEVQSVDGGNLTVSSVPSTVNAYVQVLTGSAQGRIANVTSSTGSAISLQSAIPGLSSGDTIAVREHFVMQDLSSAINAEAGDVITVANSDGSFQSFEYFDGFGWHDLSADLEANDFEINPGEAFVLAVGSPRSITFLGSVSTAPVVRAVPSNGVVSIIGTLNPVAGQDLQTLLTSPSVGDVVTVFANSGGGLLPVFTAEYFEGFGFYDLVNVIDVGDFVVESGSGITLQSSSGSILVVHNPAF